MSKQIELENLDRAIRDGNIRAQTVKTNMEILSREIESLDQAEIALEENLKFLKQQKIIAIAEEFKKIKDELARVRVRLITSKNERADYQKSLDHTNQTIQWSIEAIDKIKRNGDNNVLHANFGKKCDG
jgi:chromosome segregation ATPase